jgi:hypothetical protein
MSSFYTSEFDKLFNITGNDKMVYRTDMIYGYKDLDTGFKSMVNLSGFLKPVTGLSISRVTSESVNDVIEGKSSTLVVDNANFKGADKDALVVEYNASQTSQASSEAAERIYNDLVASLGNPTDATVASELATVPTDHRKAYTFMENIVLSICNWKYANVKSELLTTLQSSTSMLSDIKTAGEELRLISKPKEASLMTNLHTTCSQAIASMVKNQAPSTFLLSGFAEGPTFSNNRFRTTLREAMYSKLILREYKGTNVKDEVLMYLRRLLVEVYVVSFYPYIHFMYINELLKKFQTSGNFVNMRVAALVRVAFTINILLTYFQESGTLLQQNTRTQRLSTIITQWAETLKNYMTAISRVDFKNKDATIQNVISGLHTMSSKVTSQAMNVEELKESIKTLQLQMRSIMTLFKSINNERSRKATQYGLLVFLLVLIVVVSALMIVFNLYKDYLLYSLIGVCSLIVIVRVVFTIIEMVKLNK